MTTANDQWNDFCDRASAVMRDALENRASLEQASDFFEHNTSISNPDLRRYVEYIIWEIDGSPRYYTELMDLFASRASEQELVKYVNSKQLPKRSVD